MIKPSMWKIVICKNNKCLKCKIMKLITWYKILQKRKFGIIRDVMGLRW